MGLPGSSATLSALRAMQSILVNEVLVGGVSPWAPLLAADATRYGVGKAVFIGQPKDMNERYLPQAQLVPLRGDPQHQPVALAGYVGRGSDAQEVRLLVLVDHRTDWWAGEQQILGIRDALWPVLLKHALLGGSVPGVVEAVVREGRGLGYEEVAGVVYRTYEAIWAVRQQWLVPGGVVR